MKAQFFHVNLRFQKEKIWRNITFTTMADFASLAVLYMQITLHSADFAGDKNVIFDFSDACLLGHPVYFD